MTRLLYGERTTRLDALIPVSVDEALEARAQRESRSKSQVVVIALRGWLRQAGDLPKESSRTDVK